MSLIVPTSFFSNVTFVNDPVIGKNTYPYFTAVFDGVVYPDNSVVIVGAFSAVDVIPSDDIAKLDSFGNLNVSQNKPQFGGNPPDPTPTYNTAVAQLNDNLFVAGTFSTVDTFSTPRIACLRKNFTLDLGKCPTVNGPVNFINCTTLNPALPKVLLCGSFTSPKNKIAMFEINSFDNIQVSADFTPPTITGDVYKGIFTDPFNITVCGNFTSGTRRGIMKLTDNGTSWGVTTFFAGLSSGYVVDFDYVDKTYSGMPNSDIIIGGIIARSGTTTKSVVRITSSGTLNPSWNTNIPDTKRTDLVFFESDSSRLNNGKIFCFLFPNELVLIDGVTGIIDTSFNNNTGKIVTNGTGGIGAITKILPLVDNTYALCGDFTSLDGDTSKYAYARITHNGTVL